jgi:hypothetical protein
MYNDQTPTVSQPNLDHTHKGIAQDMARAILNNPYDIQDEMLQIIREALLDDRAKKLELLQVEIKHTEQALGRLKNFNS